MSTVTGFSIESKYEGMHRDVDESPGKLSTSTGPLPLYRRVRREIESQVLLYYTFISCLFGKQSKLLAPRWCGRPHELLP
jgi:hypothetical protein